MTQFIVVSPGSGGGTGGLPDPGDPFVPGISGPQFGVKVTLLAPGGDGTRVVFNDDTDADYVGWLSNISGLDSPDVRESADDLIGEDGGVHGDFFHGRRPVVIEGLIDSRPDNITRNLRMTKLQRVTNAMRSDMSMRWSPDGGIEQVLYMRRQQPLRITGAYNKTFQAALVAADPRIYSAQVKETHIAANGTGVVTNDGSAATPPTLTVYGPATGISITDLSHGMVMNFASGFTVAAGQYLVIDIANKTIMLNGTTDSYQYLTFATSTWWLAQPGDSNVHFTATGTTGSSALVVDWQDAWV